ncbi:MAG: hypothetical protein L3V56_06225 [Candidatus Magnetoovum sp. WYHC-5]|nr:hypothetical protein [Candidatus Magnetoovum sp. WYHC-5]
MVEIAKIKSMRLFKRSNGTWYVEIKRGVWRSLQTKDEKEAKIRFKALQREVLQGKLVAIDKQQSITLSLFLKNMGNGQVKMWLLQHMKQPILY